MRVNGTIIFVSKLSLYLSLGTGSKYFFYMLSYSNIILSFVENILTASEHYFMHDIHEILFDSNTICLGNYLTSEVVQ